MHTSDLQTSIYGQNTPLAARQVLANMALSHWLEEQQPCGRLGMDPVPPTVVRTCLRLAAHSPAAVRAAIAR